MCVGLSGVFEILEMSATFVISILAVSGFCFSSMLLAAKQWVWCWIVLVFLCGLLAVSVGAWFFVVVLVKKEVDLIDNGSTHAAIGFITRRCYSS